MILSVAIAGLTGALSSPEVSGTMRGGIETGGAGTTARESLKASPMAQSVCSTSTNRIYARCRKY